MPGRMPGRTRAARRPPTGPGGARKAGASVPRRQRAALPWFQELLRADLPDVLLAGEDGVMELPGLGRLAEVAAALAEYPRPDRAFLLAALGGGLVDEDKAAVVRRPDEAC